MGVWWVLERLDRGPWGFEWRPAALTAGSLGRLDPRRLRATPWPCPPCGTANPRAYQRALHG